MKKYIIISIISLLFCSLSYAGFNGPTYHSRANCINNETISWDAIGYHNWITSSIHLLYKIIKNGDHSTTRLLTSHSRLTLREKTWRSAAMDWKEGMNHKKDEIWVVIGEHFHFDEKGQICLIQRETVSDCSSYDGWVEPTQN